MRARTAPGWGRCQDEVRGVPAPYTGDRGSGRSPIRSVVSEVGPAGMVPLAGPGAADRPDLLLVAAQDSEIAEEYYFSFLLDRGNRTFLAMCSAEGGMEIEQLAVDRPEALARVPIDPIGGVDRAKAAEIAAQGNIPGAVADQAARSSSSSGTPSSARTPRWSR
jgi:hypothetical protein